MFERPHHRRIATVLEALDADLLQTNACLLGGSVAMALRHGDYRESADLDFRVCRIEGYRELRQRLTSPGGIRAICRLAHPLTQIREVRADFYGIRTLLRVDGADVKFEIVLEARIALEPPGPTDLLCGVATLTPLDMVTCKLLAHSESWRDETVFCRDLIDLAMMAPNKALLRRALAKAHGAYGDSVVADLTGAIDDLRARPHRLDQCLKSLSMTSVSKAALWARIKALMV